MSAYVSLCVRVSVCFLGIRYIYCNILWEYGVCLDSHLRGKLDQNDIGGEKKTCGDFQNGNFTIYYN